MSSFERSPDKESLMTCPPGSDFYEFGELQEWDVISINFPMNMMREALEEAIAQLDESGREVVFSMMKQWIGIWIYKRKEGCEEAEAQCPFCGAWIRIAHGGISRINGVSVAQLRREIENPVRHRLDCLWRQMKERENAQEDET